MSDYIVELFYDGAWNNITPDVRDADPIIMQRGRRDWATNTDPSTLTLRLNNGVSRVAVGVQGRYSPRNPRSDLYGKIGRNTPIRVRVDGDRAAYLALPGVVGSYASTPDAAALDITGDIDLRAHVALNDWASGTNMAFVSKWGAAGTRSYIFQTDTTDVLQLSWSTDGTAVSTALSTAAPTVADGEDLWVRATLDVNNGAAGKDVTFYTSTDGTNWTQLGAVVTTGGTTSIFDSTSTVNVGAHTDGTANLLSGKVYAVQVRSGIGGGLATVPEFDQQEPGTTSFTDDNSKVWTLFNSATIADDSVRFTGEVHSWPVEWDLSGGDRWMAISAAGLTRRLQQGPTPLKSSLFRDLSTASDVTDYWPLEEERGATRFYSGLDNNTSTLTPSPSTAVSSASDSTTFVASSALPTVGAGSISGTVSAYSGATNQRFTVLAAVPADVTWSSEKLLFRLLSTGGTITRWDILINTFGSVRLIAYNVNGAGVENKAAGFAMYGSPCAMSLKVTQSGADTDWTLTKLPLDGSASVVMSDPIPGETFGRFSSVELGATTDVEGTTFGHAFILNDDTETVWNDFFTIMTGRAGETGLERLVRLSVDESLPAVRAIGENDSEAMGAQRQKTLVELFREVPGADLGILSDRPDALGVQYRSRNDLYANEPVLTLDYTSGLISAPFHPVEDDQYVANDVTVTRPFGARSRVRATSGPLSVQSPPDGVGTYDISQEVNVESDTRLPEQASWRLHLGTIDEPRFPELTLNLRNPRNQIMESTILGVREGDIIRITNPPEWLPAGPYDLFVEAIREEKTAVTHILSFNCSPGSAWQVGVYDDEDGVGESRYSSDGSTLAAEVSAGLLLGGVSPGRASTPDAAALDIVGDLDLRAHVALHDWSPASGQNPVSKWNGTGNQRSYLLEVRDAGILRFAWSADGANALIADSTVGVSAADGEDLWIRATIDVDNGAAGRTVTFYTSADGSTWTQLGAAVTTAGVTSIFNSTAALIAGASDDGTDHLVSGQVYSVEVRDGIGGTVVANPNFGAQAAGTTSFADGAGRTWTITAPGGVVGAGFTVHTPDGPLWGDADAPYDIDVAGERIRVTAVAGTTPFQSFTVTRSVNGVVKTQTVGNEVRLFKPTYYAL